jgi:hypothetical protein
MSLDLVLVLALEEVMRYMSIFIYNLHIILKNVIHLIKHEPLFLYYSYYPIPFLLNYL